MFLGREFPFFEFFFYKLGRSLSGFDPGRGQGGCWKLWSYCSPPEVCPGEEDAHERGVGADAHGAEREEDDAGGLVLGVALERVLPGGQDNSEMEVNPPCNYPFTK